ncbi:MAG TPA: hypothetical protein DG754_08095, partial [Bacteroidales bacterium]|nr:hypothetical protein [Bacteroidales bacterium]
MTNCKQAKQGFTGSPIPQTIIDKTIDELVDQHGDNALFRIERGVNQAATLWREGDGNADEFTSFCNDNFIANDNDLEIL